MQNPENIRGKENPELSCKLQFPFGNENGDSNASQLKNCGHSLQKYRENKLKILKP